MLSVKKSQLKLFLLKTLSKYLCSSAKLSCESQTSSPRLVKLRMVVGLCEVGL